MRSAVAGKARAFKIEPASPARPPASPHASGAATDCSRYPLGCGDGSVARDPRAEEKRLLAALERLHRRAMGISMPVFGRARQSPLPFASIWAAAYVLVAAALLGRESAAPEATRASSASSSGGWSIPPRSCSSRRLATLRALDIVRRDILPYATPALRRGGRRRPRTPRFSALMRWVVPLARRIRLASGRRARLSALHYE